MKKTAAAIILSAMIGWIWISVGRRDSAQPDISEGKRRVSVIMPSAEDVFWEGMWDEIREASSEKGLYLSEYPYVFGSSEQVVANELEKVILSKPDGIILSSNQYLSEDIRELTKRAREQGIRVLFCDSDGEAELRDCYVGSDNEEAGRAAAKLTAEMEDIDKVLVFVKSDEKVSNASWGRLQAFREEMKALGKDFLIEEVTLSDVGEEHYEEIQNVLLGEDRKKKAIVCFNSSSTLVVAQAVQRLNEEETYEIIGFSESERAFSYVSDGTVNTLFTQDIEMLGQEAVKYMDIMLSGEETWADTALIRMNVYERQEE